MDLTSDHEESPVPSNVEDVRAEIEKILELRKEEARINRWLHHRKPYEISVMSDENFSYLKSTEDEHGWKVANPSFVMTVPDAGNFEMAIVTPECIYDAAEFLTSGTTYDRENR